MRADVFLVEHGFAASRAEAQAAIRAGNVTASGKPIAKPSQDIADGADIAYAPAHPYVSRGALKLIAALDAFALTPEGLTCLDIGASTGGFSQVLLERGAKKVFAVDVGRGQLHDRLRNDKRVENCEATDMRHFAIPENITAIVADVSFISLKLVLAPVLAAITHPAWLVALVKPQFEAGRDAVGKGGIVKDAAVQDAVLQDMVTWLGAQPGWTVLGTMDSPITGGDGNREFLMAARRA